MSCLSTSSAWILNLSPYLKVHSRLRKYPLEAFLIAPSFNLASCTVVGDMDKQIEEFEDAGGFAFKDTDEGDFMEDPDDIDDAL